MAEPTPDQTEELFKHVDHYLDQIQITGTRLLDQYGPQITDAALELTRANGLVNIATGLVLLVISAILALSVIPLWKWAQRVDPDQITPTCLIPVISGSISLILGVISLTYLFDFWAWIDIFDPRLGLIHDLVSRASK